MKQRKVWNISHGSPGSFLLALDVASEGNLARWCGEPSLNLHSPIELSVFSATMYSDRSYFHYTLTIIIVNLFMFPALSPKDKKCILLIILFTVS